MHVIGEVEVENLADRLDEGFGSGGFVDAVEVVAIIDFVDFAGIIAAGVDVEIARQRDESGVAGCLVETDHHDRVGEAGAVVDDTFKFGARHVEARGAEKQNVGALVLVFLQRAVSFGDKIHEVALAAGETG